MSLKKSVGLIVGLFAVVAMMFIVGCADNNTARLPTAFSPQDNGTISQTVGCIVAPNNPPTPVVIVHDTIYVFIGDALNFVPVDKRTNADANPVITSYYNWGDGSKTTAGIDGLKPDTYSYSSVGIFMEVLTAVLSSSSIKDTIYVVVKPHKTVVVDTTKVVDTTVITPVKTPTFSADSAFLKVSVVSSSTVGQFVVTFGTSVSDVYCGCPSLNPFQHGYDNWAMSGAILLKSVPLVGNLYEVSRSLKPGVYHVLVGSVWNGTDSASTCLDVSKINTNEWYDPVQKLFSFCLDYNGKLYHIADSAKCQLAPPTPPFSADSAFLKVSVVSSSTVGQFVVTFGTSVSDVYCGCPSLNPFQHGYDNWAMSGAILLKSVPLVGNLYEVSRSLKPGVYHVLVGSVWNGTDSASTCLDVSKINTNEWYDPVQKLFSFCLDYNGKLYHIADSASCQVTPPVAGLDMTFPGTYGDDYGPFWNWRFSDYIHSNVAGGLDTIVVFVSLWNLDACTGSAVTFTSNIPGLGNVTMIHPAGKRFAYASIPVANIPDSTGALCNYALGSCVQTNHSGTKYWNSYYNAYEFRVVEASLAKAINGKTAHLVQAIQ